MLEKMRQMEGTQEWIDKYGRVGDEGKMALLLGRSVTSLEREVEDRVDVMEKVRRWWQRRKEPVYGRITMNLDPYNPKLGSPINNHVMIVIIIHFCKSSSLYL